MLTITNLTKKFGNKTILDNINFQFERGKIYGIVGENGAGKTTFFRCISQIEDCSGEIISEISPFKQHLGYIMAENHFLTKITGEEYIRLLLEARGQQQIDILSKNIFDLPLSQYVESYSTGMKKKLVITSILLQDNSFIIMDEPFNGLDLSSSLVLTELIKVLKEKGKTVILSSHIFSSLVESCDVILKLDNGRLSDPIAKENFQDLENELKSKLLPDNIRDFI